ncbi:molybdopterin-guanine dinucleotide biosynthesis protein MobB [Methanoculleus chikugoensis]|uniref:molybdopterin-guanine dinucleotide biosynthesis protein B n=1 Tax=Methanoculleus chikugoensis TaxID=118126 RepID=UPI001FB25060|nr:molybdopterin-guanine dinucleotide biosynthesis protein MobB [Methanoculleus chikugoensis]
MKIIQVVGRSNAGKTTFIKNLIGGALSAHGGAVGAVKHLGHHAFRSSPERTPPRIMNRMLLYPAVSMKRSRSSSGARTISTPPWRFSATPGLSMLYSRDSSRDRSRGS